MNVTSKSLNNEFKSNYVEREKVLVFYHDLSIWKEKWYQLCEILEKQVMNILHFSITNVDIPQSHNGL
jgi:hypothetical protein